MRRNLVAKGLVMVTEFRSLPSAGQLVQVNTAEGWKRGVVLRIEGANRGRMLVVQAKSGLFRASVYNGNHWAWPCCEAAQLDRTKACAGAGHAQAEGAG